jgi:hypothetical protein
LLWAMSPGDSPLSFLLRDGGLVHREHSEPLAWHEVHPSSSSLMMQREPLNRQARQGKGLCVGDPETEEAESPIPGLRRLELA